MKKIHQNTEEWHEWRSQGIGSSDVPIIMGISSYKTPYQLWQERVGLIEPIDNDENYVIKRGSAMEKTALDYYKSVTGFYEMEPACLVSKLNSVFRASLDGYSISRSKAVEIKCLGDSKNHQASLKLGKIPEEYKYQMFYQMLVSGLQNMDYLSFSGNDGIIIPLNYDPKIGKEIAASVLKFWDCIKYNTPPDLSEKDYKVIDDPEVLALIDDYVVYDNVMKECRLNIDKLREKIKGKLKHPRSKTDKISIFHQTRLGTIDLKKIPELEGVDLDKYRGDPINTLVFKVKN